MKATITILLFFFVQNISAQKAIDTCLYTHAAFDSTNRRILYDSLGTIKPKVTIKTRKLGALVDSREDWEEYVNEIHEWEVLAVTGNGDYALACRRCKKSRLASKQLLTPKAIP